MTPEMLSIKKRLGNYRALCNERDHLHGMLSDLEAVMYGPRSPRLDGQPRGASGGTGGPTEQMASRHADLERLYNEAVEVIAEELRAVEGLIASLQDTTQRDVLRLHYLKGIAWEDVADAKGYSARQIFRIRNKALWVLSNQ